MRRVNVMTFFVKCWGDLPSRRSSSERSLLLAGYRQRVLGIDASSRLKEDSGSVSMSVASELAANTKGSRPVERSPSVGSLIGLAVSP